MPITCRPHSIEVFTTPYEAPEAIAAVMAVIAGAQRSLDVQLYVLTRLAFVDAICEAHHRGVALRVILDHSQSLSLSAITALGRLAEALTKDRIRIGTSPRYHTLMHSKLAIADRHVIATGSFNWSNDASREVNDLLIMHSRSLAKVYTGYFNELWNWITTYEAAYQSHVLPQQTGVLLD